MLCSQLSIIDFRRRAHGYTIKKEPFKSLSARKADRKDEMYDVLVDMLLRITWDARMYWSGEVRPYSVLAFPISVP